MLAHILITVVIAGIVLALGWHFLVKPLLNKALPEDDEPTDESIDELREHHRQKLEQLEQLERDAETLSEEVDTAEKIRAKKEEVRKLSDRLEQLERRPLQ